MLNRSDSKSRFGMFFVLAAVIATTAQALTDEECKAWGDVAEEVMTIRQTDAPLNETLSAMQAAHTTPLAVQNIRNLVIEAYKTPAVPSLETLKASMIAAFRNTAELACFTGELQ